MPLINSAKRSVTTLRPASMTGIGALIVAFADQAFAEQREICCAPVSTASGYPPSA